MLSPSSGWKEGAVVGQLCSVNIPNDNAILCRLLSIKLTEAAKNLLLSKD